MAWPTHLLHPLPPGLSGTEGAVLEPLGVAIHAFDLGHVPAASTVAVIGCGPIGLLLLQVALASGATRVLAVDPLAHRRDEAVRLGAFQALTPEEASTEPMPGDVDVAFEMAGNDLAVGLAMILVRPGGRVVLGGIPPDDRTSFPASLARRKGLTLALVRRMKDDVYERGIRLAQTARVELASLVTARFPLEQAGEAFRSAVSRQGLKVVIQPSR
jgi:L-iditol 2-dehydrogenase